MNCNFFHGFVGGGGTSSCLCFVGDALGIVPCHRQRLKDVPRLYLLDIEDKKSESKQIIATEDEFMISILSDEKLLPKPSIAESQTSRILRKT